jgi:hypothetical protein
MYDEWEQAAIRISVEKPSAWKKDRRIIGILEHLSVEFAVEYLKFIKTVFSNSQIETLAALNDRVGEADVKTISDIRTSPSSVRYIAHSIEICQHILKKGLNDVTIIEVGGGYGGLALILSEVSKLFNVRIAKYIIYDLPGVRRIQQFYLSNFKLPYEVQWNESSTFGSDLAAEGTNFLVSAYCISELPRGVGIHYLRNLLPKISGAFIVWNMSPLFGLPDTCDIRPEVPETGPGNLIVRI